jgi:hypothetical protein
MTSKVLLHQQQTDAAHAIADQQWHATFRHRLQPTIPCCKPLLIASPIGTLWPKVDIYDLSLACPRTNPLQL